MLLYIHIPFCDSKCFYCSFNSYTNLFHLKEKYMEALKIQLIHEIKNNKIKHFESIFFGGGTPSSVESNLYESVFKILNPYITKNTEITFEANPNSASKEWLGAIKELGATRISFGVQSFDNKKLKFLGRNHSKEQAISAINHAKDVGFKHINMDIIYDTSMDTKELLTNDLQIIHSLPIDHISAYSLTIEEGTKFFKKPQVKIENIDFAKYLFSSLNSFGFQQYEISNFSKDINSKSKHNYGYWEKKDYLGVGAGAVGAIKNKRYYPTKDVEKYILNPLSYEDTEILEDSDILFETIFLALRSDVGLDMNILNEKQKSNIKFLLEEGKLYKEDNTVYNKDFLLTDEIVLFID